MPIEIIIGLVTVVSVLLIYLLGYIQGKDKGVEKGFKLALKHLKELKDDS